MQNFLLAFIPMFVAVDAIGNVPFFLSLTEGFSPAERSRVAKVSVLVATVIILVFVVGGRLIFLLMGITLIDVRIAGGILLLAFSIHMLLTGKSQLTGTEDIAIFPLASPLLAGPAVLTITLVLSKSRGPLITLASVVINMAIAWVCFRYASSVERILTRQGTKAFSKVVEILLAAIAIMMIRHGVTEYLASLG